MTNEEINNLIATKVMGLDYKDKWGAWYICEGPYILGRFRPSTDLNDSFMALEKWCEEKNLKPEVSKAIVMPIWVVTLYDKKEYNNPMYLFEVMCKHESLAMAICHALIEAVGVELWK